MCDNYRSKAKSNWPTHLTVGLAALGKAKRVQHPQARVLQPSRPAPNNNNNNKNNNEILTKTTNK